MIESMKEKTRRLERIIKGKNAGKTDTFVFSEVRKMIELALAEEREANGWQPIETAPKNGTEIDLWVHGERIADCKLLNGKWMFYGIDSFDSPGHVVVEGDPTHFMHKPAAPKAEVSE